MDNQSLMPQPPRRNDPRATERQYEQSSMLPPAPASALSVKNTHPTVVTATAQALQAGADPANLAKARDQLGNQAYIGLCEKFTENANGQDNLYPTAADAWQAQQSDAVKGTLQGIQPGDEIYYAPDASNNGAGHVSIYAGGNSQIGATDAGVEPSDIGQWQQSTGQQLEGYIPLNRGGK